MLSLRHEIVNELDQPEEFPRTAIGGSNLATQSHRLVSGMRHRLTFPPRNTSSPTNVSLVFRAARMMLIRHGANILVKDGDIVRRCLLALVAKQQLDSPKRRLALIEM